MRRMIIIIFLLLWYGCSKKKPQMHLPMAVGFSVAYERDSSRTLPGVHKFRPIQLSTWYPSNESSGPTMTYEDYFALSGSELQSEPVGRLQEDSLKAQYKKLLESNGVPVHAADSLFQFPMRAEFNAAPHSGMFPLVIVAQGNFHSAHHQAYLCEAMASHGYVVITSPSQTRITGPMTSDKQVASNMTDQLTDMEFIYRKASALPDVDTNIVIVLGHSFGGRAIALFAGRHRNTKGVISLDGGIGLQGAADDIRNHPLFQKKKFKADILHFYETLDPFVTPDFSLMDELTNSRRMIVRLEHFHHFYFTSFGAIGGSIEGLVPGYTPEAKHEWDEMEQIILSFLDRVSGKSDGNGNASSLKPDTADSLTVN